MSSIVQDIGNIQVVVGSGGGSTATETFVNESQASVALVASNTNRLKVIIVNESNKSLWIRYVSPADEDVGIEIKAGDIWVEGDYTGVIYGSWDSGAKDGARVTEITTQ